MVPRPMILLATALVHLSSAGPPAPDTPFTVALDFAQFRYGEGQNYLEVYYALSADQLTYEAQGDQYAGALQLHVLVIGDVEDDTVVSQTWRIPYQVADPGTISPGESMVGVLKLAVPDGRHHLKVIYQDEHNTSRWNSAEFELSRKGFESGQLALSDVEICASLRKVPRDPTNIFYKNTYEAIPFPGRICTPSKPVIFYYVEAYNLLAGGAEGSYYLHTSVRDLAGREILADHRSKPKVGESAVEVGTVNVHKLPPGAYALSITLGDSAAGLTASSSKVFFVYASTEPPAEEAVLSSPNLKGEYERLGEAELDQEFAYLMYITRRPDRRQYRKLPGIEDKRAYLYQFWESRNPTPGSPANDFRLEYLRRVEYANQRYTVGMRQGWQTDRGRVVIIYGEPDNVDRYRYEVSQKPYEIWSYDSLQGGVYFVFIDETGFNDYTLVHSTARDELQDPLWQSRLSPNR